MPQYNNNRASFIEKVNYEAKKNNTIIFNNTQFLIKFVAQKFNKKKIIKLKKIKKTPHRRIKAAEVYLKSSARIQNKHTIKGNFKPNPNPLPQRYLKKTTPFNLPLVINNSRLNLLGPKTTSKQTKPLTPPINAKCYKNVIEQRKSLNMFKPQKKKTKRKAIRLLFKSYTTEHLVNYLNSRRPLETDHLINIPYNNNHFTSLNIKTS
jgi:hypothetical protein